MDKQGRLPSRKKEKTLSLLLFILPAVLCVAYSQGIIFFIFNGPGLAQYIDKRRPSDYDTVDKRVQAQLFHLDVAAHDSAALPSSVAIVGSSSVVNGVDEAVVSRIIAPSGFHADKFGLTGLTAYELPMLADLIAPQGRKIVVFFYNLFMFGGANDMEVLRKWKTSESFNVFTLGDLRLKNLNRITYGIASEFIPLMNFNQFFKRQLFRGLAGDLEPVAYDYGFDPNGPQAMMDPNNRVAVPALTKWIAESDTMSPTPGWRGFERFLAILGERSVTAIIIPVPLPPSSPQNVTAGINIARIDGRVAALCLKYNQFFAPRASLPPFSDYHFADNVHPNKYGRNYLSLWLGGKLRDFLMKQGVS